MNALCNRRFWSSDRACIVLCELFVGVCLSTVIQELPRVGLVSYPSIAIGVSQSEADAARLEDMRGAVLIAPSSVRVMSGSAR